MATAQKQKNGKWTIRVGIGSSGKSKKFTADSKKEVELLAAAYLLKKHTPDEEYTLSEALDKYIEERSNIASPSTIAGYRQIQRNNLGRLAGVRLCDITQKDMQAYVNEMATHYSPKTIRNMIGLTSSTYREFCPDAIDFNSLALPPRKRRTVVFPQVSAILAAVEGTDIELPILMALWLGMRMSEIRGARRCDIHDGILTIQTTVLTVDGEDVERENTKTYGSTRSIRLPQRIIDLIAALPPDQERLVQKTHAAIYQRFVKLLKKNNLPPIGLHDLRHLNASVMLSLGVQDKFAMERGGWSSPAVMRGTYQHTFSEDRTRVDDLIDSFFAAASNPEKT